MTWCSIQRFVLWSSFLGFLFGVEWAVGHEESLSRQNQARLVALAKADSLAEDPQEATAARPTCRLTIDLLDADTQRPLAGMVRVTRLDNGKAVKLIHEIHRALNWYALPARTTVMAPRTKLKIEAFHGLETETQVLEVDATATEQTTVQIALKRFYNPRTKGLSSGNTHLHLQGMTYAEALRYLRVVPQADGLDLVFLSHLRRLPDEPHMFPTKSWKTVFRKIAT